MAVNSFNSLLRMVCSSVYNEDKEVKEVKSIAGYALSEQAQGLLVSLVKLCMSTDYFKPDTKEYLTNIYSTVRTVSGVDGYATNKHTRRSRINYDLSILRAVLGEDSLDVIVKQYSNKKAVTNSTFNDIIKEWRESDKYNSLSPKTIDRYEGMLKHNIIPAFGVWRLEEIRPLHIKRFISDLRKPGARVNKNDKNPYSDKTVRGYYILLHTLFDCAVKWEMVSENVCDKADKPQIKKHQANFYDAEQIDKMLTCLEEEGEKLEISLLKRNPNHRNKTEQRKKELKEERRYMYKMHRAYVYLALASACRRSELCGLNWTDINFDTEYMSINKTLQYSHSAGKFEKDFLKNGDTEKSMYLPSKVMEVLKEYEEEQHIYRAIMGEKWVDSGKIFTNRKGDLILDDAISAWFRKFIERNELPHITLHEVRHTSISFMLMENLPIKVVAERAGHSDTSVTTKIYGHVFEDNKRKAAETINKMFEKETVSANIETTK